MILSQIMYGDHDDGDDDIEKRRIVTCLKFSAGKADTIHRASLRLTDISNMLGNDWVALAHELEISDSDINIIKSQYPDNAPQQAIVMLRLWMQTVGNKVVYQSWFLFSMEEQYLLFIGRFVVPYYLCIFLLKANGTHNDLQFFSKYSP